MGCGPFGRTGLNRPVARARDKAADYNATCSGSLPAWNANLGTAMPVRTWNKLLGLLEAVRIRRGGTGPDPVLHKRSRWLPEAVPLARRIRQRRLPRHVLRARMRLS